MPHDFIQIFAVQRYLQVFQSARLHDSKMQGDPAYSGFPQYLHISSGYSTFIAKEPRSVRTHKHRLSFGSIVPDLNWNLIPRVVVVDRNRAQ